MTKQELAHTLRELAQIYEKPENENLVQPGLHIFVDTKDQLLALVRAIGGKFTKDMGSEWESYPNVTLESLRLGVKICIPKDKVCRKVVRYDCEPLLSPQEEAEVDEAIA